RKGQAEGALVRKRAVPHREAASVQRSMQRRADGLPLPGQARAFDSGDGPVEVAMAGVGSYESVFVEVSGRRARIPPAARRAMLLLGTSLLVQVALPSAAQAQEECGPPPGGG